MTDMTDSPVFSPNAAQSVDREGSSPEAESADVQGEAMCDEPAAGSDSELAALQSRLAELEAQLAAQKDQMLRALAEAGNARQRAERDIAQARDYAIERFARDMLPIADNLERALQAAAQSTQDSPRNDWPEALRQLYDGIELTERALLTNFERHGLKKVAATGSAFDPNLHQAVAQIPSDIPAGQVAETFQSGFTLAGRVLRAAMVAVSAGQATQGAPRADAKGAE